MISAVTPTFLDTVIVNVTVPASSYGGESDADLEDRVKDALSKMKLVHAGSALPLNYGRAGMGSRKAVIAAAEPVDQGFLRPETKIVVVKDTPKRRQRKARAKDGVILGGDASDSVDT